MIGIVIRKRIRLLEVINDGHLVCSYHISLGSQPIGPKRCEGDGRTPEGDYYVCTRNTQSKFHLSLGLSYPNENDARRGLKEGLIQEAEVKAVVEAEASRKRPPWDTPLGGFIMIHGGGTKGDWTAGCVALMDCDMDDLFPQCPLGTPVHIEP